MIHNYFLKKNQRGFLVLTLVLLVFATVLIVAMGIFLRSIGGIKEGADSEASLKAWSTANACGEYALLQISALPGYYGWGYASGTGELLSVGEETCYIYPVVASGTGKLIKASSTVSSFTRKILIDVATNSPSLKVVSWKTVADF